MASVAFAMANASRAAATLRSATGGANFSSIARTSDSMPIMPVTAAELLSVAAFHDGKFAQAFPSFGSERMGAPVLAFCRIAQQAIRTREPIVTPNAVVIQDPTLLHVVEVFQGLTDDGSVLINTTKSISELGLDDLQRRLARGQVQAVPATQIAIDHIGRPVPNVVLLGALAALTGVVSLASLGEAIRRRFAGVMADANIAAAAAGHGSLRGSAPC